MTDSIKLSFRVVGRVDPRIGKRNLLLDGVHGKWQISLGGGIGEEQCDVKGECDAAFSQITGGFLVLLL